MFQGNFTEFTNQCSGDAKSQLNMADNNLNNFCGFLSFSVGYKYSSVFLEHKYLLIQYYFAEFKNFEYETAALR
jgi:hypothetical protein